MDLYLRLLRFLKPYLSKLVLAMIFMSLVAATNGLTAFIVKPVLDKIFFEIIIAPGFTDSALDILKQKKNRIILLRNDSDKKSYGFRSLLNGVLWQERDNSTESAAQMKPVTTRTPQPAEFDDLVFANIIVKHSKSNAIVIARNNQLCASGIGQTSRVDALKQAIEKARTFGFDINGSVIASDAFFPLFEIRGLLKRYGENVRKFLEKPSPKAFIEIERDCEAIIKSGRVYRENFKKRLENES